VFSGVAVMEKRGKKRVLLIYSSRKDAMLAGVPEEVAKQLFPNAIAAAGECREKWSFFGGSISCESTGCAKTCTVQVNKLDGLGWTDVSEGSVVVNTNWAYQCKCK
jgi:hypothetical protein